MDDDRARLSIFNFKKQNKTKYKRKYKYAHKQGSKKREDKRLFYLLFTLTIILIIIIIFILGCKDKVNIMQKSKENNIENNMIEKLKSENIKNVLNYSLQYDKFDNNINRQYILLQNIFCENEKDNLIQEFENKISISNVNFEGKNYSMYVYSGIDRVSDTIRLLHNLEANDTKKVLNALDYYSKKKHLNNEDIHLLDIGSNISWNSYFLGKQRNKVMSFEASKINNYILYKNYCLNKDVNITIIPKGLDREEKICKLQIQRKNKGNGMVICENRDKKLNVFSEEIYDNIELTKLSNYIEFLTEKNVAFMKLDIEGSEANAIKGGKELITKYHIPFI